MFGVSHFNLKISSQNSLDQKKRSVEIENNNENYSLFLAKNCVLCEKKKKYQEKFRFIADIFFAKSPKCELTSEEEYIEYRWLVLIVKRYNHLLLQSISLLFLLKSHLLASTKSLLSNHGL